MVLELYGAGFLVSTLIKSQSQGFKVEDCQESAYTTQMSLIGVTLAGLKSGQL